jgi:hypothetical protein
MAKKAKGKDGARTQKKAQAGKQDVAARKAGATAARPKDKSGAPKAERAGKTKGKGGAGSPTHKDFSAAELARNERPVRGRQGR